MLIFSSYWTLSTFFLEWKVEIYSGFLLSLYYFSSKSPIKNIFFLKSESLSKPLYGNDNQNSGLTFLLLLPCCYPLI